MPSASADLMVKTYQPADALMTIPIIPYVNKSEAWSCSFPVSVYGAQQSTNPYVHPNGDSCGNSIASNGTQLLDTNIYANHIDNTTSLQQQWVQHLVSTFGNAASGGVKFYQLDNEPYGWSNTHRDVMPNGATYPTITQLGQQYAATVKHRRIAGLLRYRQALHSATPDFLFKLVALAHLMRLSLRKGAHAALSSAAWQEIRVRSGRDDKRGCA